MGGDDGGGSEAGRTGEAGCLVAGRGLGIGGEDGGGSMLLGMVGGATLGAEAGDDSCARLFDKIMYPKNTNILARDVHSLPGEQVTCPE